MSPSCHLCVTLLNVVSGFSRTIRFVDLKKPGVRLKPDTTSLERVSHSQLHRARRADTGQRIELGARPLIERVAKIVSIREVVQFPVEAKPASHGTQRELVLHP